MFANCATQVKGRCTEAYGPEKINSIYEDTSTQSAIQKRLPVR